MQLTVSIRGRVLDDDRVISVYGDRLIVTDHGKIRADRRLEPEAVDQVEKLANEVMGVSIPERVQPKVVDGGTTTIEIASERPSGSSCGPGRMRPNRYGRSSMPSRRAVSGRGVVAPLTVPGDRQDRHSHLEVTNAAPRVSARG